MAAWGLIELKASRVLWIEWPGSDELLHWLTVIFTFAPFVFMFVWMGRGLASGWGEYPLKPLTNRDWGLLAGLIAAFLLGFFVHRGLAP